MWGGGGQGGCERRIEVFVKIQKKKIVEGGGRGVRVDVNEELKFWENSQKNSGGGGGSGEGGRVGGGSGWWGCQGGCE